MKETGGAGHMLGTQNEDMRWKHFSTSIVEVTLQAKKVDGDGKDLVRQQDRKIKLQDPYSMVHAIPAFLQ